MVKVAKVFKNGKDYHFNTNGIYTIKHNKAQKWDKFFKDLKDLDSTITSDFLANRNQPFI